ncbi:MAG: ABC transporter ATP-binding protein/permease [Candidatus Nomurabacteria bacterium]|jgi:ATP-binding cassette subfamily B protein|nr:ABC transporter ATP-binding protein/permease [Candidatus Nomurabacteria bacterium]
MPEQLSTDDLKKFQQKRRGGHGIGRVVEKPKHFSKTMKHLIRYMKGDRWRLLLAVILAVASTVFTIVAPRMLGDMTNEIVADYVAINVYDQIDDAVKTLPQDLQPTIPKGTVGVDGLTKFFKNWQSGLKSKAAQIAARAKTYAAMSPSELAALTPTQKSQMQNDAADLKALQSMQNSKGTSTVDPDALAGKIPASVTDRLKNLDWSKKPTMRYDILGGTAMLLIGFYLISAICGYLRGWTITGVTQRAAYRFRRDISAKINRLPLRYFDTRPYGDVLSRITNDVDLIAMSLTQTLNQLFTSITMIIGVIVMMLTISLELTGIAVVVIPISLIFVSLIIKHSQKYFKRQQDSLGDINGHTEEIYAGHNVVKAFGGERRAIVKFDKFNRELRDSAWKSQFLSGLMFPIMNLLSNLGYVGVACLGGWMAINGRIQVGDIQAFIQYVGRMNQPIVQLSNIANVIQSTAAAAERVFEFLAEPDETPDPKNAQTIYRAKGDVEFSNVKFGYDPTAVIIPNFSARIKAGQKIAIVGPTGAGKTTLVNLLMRFYDPQNGLIKIDGIDTGEMTRADVRRQFAMVLQDTWLFAGTVRENLAYGDLNASDQQIEAAAKAAHISHFVHSLPQGYDTPLDENAENISAGEKQLLTIARAMLADAPMLILDEATSSVDTRTEVLIQSAMDKLMKGRTSFVIAHRLSTIRDADLILVIDHGDIIEQGSHQDLLAAGGFYARLYNAQFEE